MKTNVIQYGVGEIGKEIARLVVNRDNYELVGALDLDEEILGKDIGKLLGMGKKVGVEVTRDSKEVLAKKPDLIFHSTGSHMVDVEGQLKEPIRAGADVISTTEELSYPSLQSPEIAEGLDRLAKEKGSTVLGTGVNPGFVMDMLPVVSTGAARKVNKISVLRVQNASKRRKPLQEKIGSGLTREEFEDQVVKGGGHIGLLESIALIGTGFDWELDEISQNIEPVIAKEKTKSEFFEVEEGQGLGIKQRGWGRKDGDKVVDLDLRMYLGAEDPRDVIRIEGNPSFEVRIDGGLHGDIATPAVVVNSAPSVRDASPGLKTVLDLPPPAFHEDFGGRGKLQKGVSK